MLQPTGEAPESLRASWNLSTLAAPATARDGSGRSSSCSVLEQDSHITHRNVDKG